MKRWTLAAGLLAASLTGAAGAADIKIAHVYSKTGPLEAFARQTQTGLMMGLEYATGGTMTVAGRRIVVIEKDDHGKPDIGKMQLTSAYHDDRVDLAVGPTASGVAIAMLPVAREYKKILIVEPAVADAITGPLWNKYIFRTGRNSSQDAISNAAAVDRPGITIATLAPDNAFGKDGVRAFKGALKHSRIVHEEYLPATTTDFTAGAQRLIDRLKNLPGRKVIWLAWAGGGDPFTKLADMNLKARGIELSTGGNILPAMAAFKKTPGLEGAMYYYFGIPKNPVNDWLVAEHYKRYKAPPDFFTAGGMSAGIAVVEAIKRTRGDTRSDSLIAAMEGMAFQTPKGTMVFRKEDHQALQPMYHFRIRNDPKFAWGVPELVREIRIEDMAIPITNQGRRK